VFSFRFETKSYVRVDAEVLVSSSADNKGEVKIIS